MAKVEEGIIGEGVVTAKDGKPEVSGLMYYFSKGKIDLLVLSTAIKRFFAEDKSRVIRLLELNKEELEREVSEWKGIMKKIEPYGSIVKKDVERYEAYLKLNEELLSKLKAEVRELSEDEETAILEEMVDIDNQTSWEGIWRGDVE